MATNEKVVKYNAGALKAMLRDRDSHSFLRVPVDLFKSSSFLISEYVSTTYDLGALLNWKAFIAIQSTTVYINGDNDMEDDFLACYSFNVHDFKTFKLTRRVKETDLSVEVQNGYALDPVYKRFLKVPIDKYLTTSGKLALLIESVLYTYNVSEKHKVWAVIRTLTDVDGVPSFCKANFNKIFDKIVLTNDLY